LIVKSAEAKHIHIPCDRPQSSFTMWHQWKCWMSHLWNCFGTKGDIEKNGVFKFWAFTWSWEKL